jgi:rhodanese-related sulfurtransferase/DNA-binding transcriptional ArsR family regulator
VVRAWCCALDNISLISEITKERDLESPIFHDELSRIARALGHSVRIRVVDVLTQGERSVEQLAERLELPLSTLSSQLRVLRDARLVATRREGTRIHYSIADAAVLQLLLALRSAAIDRSTELARLVDDFAQRRDELTAVELSDIDQIVDGRGVTLIDVRPRDEYEAGHIPGAVSIPLDELEDSIEQLPSGGRVIAYCRDAYCVLAPDAAAQLRALGYDAGVLAAGFSEWASGRSVQAAS